MNKIRVAIADDQNVVREGFVAILELQPDIEVVGEARDGIEALKLAKDSRPDVLILDIMMPHQSGLETIPMVKEVAPEVRILVLTSFDEGETVYQAVKSGAKGFLLKDTSRENFLKAIRDVASGKDFLEPSIAMKMINEIENPKEALYTSAPLTPRELDTLRLIARGLTNQEIAEELVVHERTVAKYVSNILNKLQLANRTQAALYALREGISDLEDE